MRKYRLAIVENDEDERFFMLDAFRAFAGFEILGEFGNGNQLLDWLSAGPQVMPELILSDLNMPGKNGYDVISETMDRFPGIKVVITSTSPVTSVREKCLGLGAFAFLLKPDVFIAYENYVKSFYKLLEKEYVSGS
jgi:DNA-binding NarL/FixJ family response regulator